MPKTKQLISTPKEQIENKIFFVRNRKVMIDSDLAKLYGVSTKRLNEQVKRNRKRFPEDFMFQLNKQEMKIWEAQFLRSQIATLKNGRGQHKKYFSYCFTEQGVAMLSSVLNSERAIQVNIQIIRTFTELREMLATNKELREKIEKMEKKYDKHFGIIFEAIKNLLEIKEEEEKKPGKRMGFVYRGKK